MTNKMRFCNRLYYCKGDTVCLHVTFIHWKFVEITWPAETLGLRRCWRSWRVSSSGPWCPWGCCLCHRYRAGSGPGAVSPFSRSVASWPLPPPQSGNRGDGGMVPGLLSDGWAQWCADAAGTLLWTGRWQTRTEGAPCRTKRGTAVL